MVPAAVLQQGRRRAGAQVPSIPLNWTPAGVFDSPPRYRLAVHTPAAPTSFQGSPAGLGTASEPGTQRQRLIGKSGGRDNISVMTLRIALNCFIGKMIVLVQFE